MGRCSEMYETALKSVKGTRKMILAVVVMWIKAVYAKPIIIGNMVYWVTTLDGEDVPAYCYLSDFPPKDGGFLPIYDENNTGEFGWSDFSECCRIFDVILDKIENG
jgi:hypothetical protein